MLRQKKGVKMTEETQNTEINDSITPKDEACKLIRNHSITSAAISLVPIPIVDIVGITGVQLNMLRRLAKVYEVPFSEHKVKNILTSLIGGGGTLPLSSVVGSLAKSIPVIGQTVGAVSMPITAGAVTYAVGKVFLQHFASGGTFLTFDPEKVRAYYEEMLSEGKTVVAAAKP